MEQIRRPKSVVTASRTPLVTAEMSEAQIEERVSRILARIPIEAQSVANELPAAYTFVSSRKHGLTPFLAHIERMSAIGMSQTDIAIRLGLIPEQFDHFFRTYDDVCAAVIGGQARGLDQILTALHESATKKGDTSAIITRLKMNGYLAPKTSSPAVVLNFTSQPADVDPGDIGSFMDSQKKIIEGQLA